MFRLLFFAIFKLYTILFGKLKRFKGRCIGPIYGTATVESIVPLAPHGVPSSPEAPRTTQARETSTSEGGN
jgi:hypothetical protein